MTQALLHTKKFRLIVTYPLGGSDQWISNNSLYVTVVNGILAHGQSDHDEKSSPSVVKRDLVHGQFVYNIG